MSGALAADGPTADVGELRAQIRHWRQGHKNTRLLDALSDAYVYVFSVLVLGSMAVNVVVEMRTLATEACVSEQCLEGRAQLPWVAGVVAVLLVLGMARLFGPVYVSPAVASWLLSTPLTRAALIRPQLLWALVLAAILGSAVGLGASALGGFSFDGVWAFSGLVGLAATCVVLLAARFQVREQRSAKLLTWTLASSLWLALLAMANHVRFVPKVSISPDFRLAFLLAVTVLVLLLAAGVIRELGASKRHLVTPGGRLAPSLSGALATLDLGLLYDVLLARRWRDHVRVRSSRAGFAGPMALVWLDLVRLVRNPQAPVLVAAAVIVPYASVTVGLGRVTLLLASLSGFLSGLGLFAALRVLSRTDAIARMLPFPTWVTRVATLAVPATVLLLCGLAIVPALRQATGASQVQGVFLAVAVSCGSIAAAVRWVTGKPPDYSSPLISSPAGAIPANLYGSAFRGFDILILTTAPLLALDSLASPVLSIALSTLVVTYLVRRD